MVVLDFQARQVLRPEIPLRLSSGDNQFLGLVVLEIGNSALAVTVACNGFDLSKQITLMPFLRWLLAAVHPYRFQPGTFRAAAVFLIANCWLVILRELRIGTRLLGAA